MIVDDALDKLASGPVSLQKELQQLCRFSISAAKRFSKLKKFEDKDDELERKLIYISGKLGSFDGVQFNQSE